MPVFGPPVFDETSYQYRKRVFKRGASWGATLTFVVTAQFAVFQNFMAPSKKSTRELIAIPFCWAFVVGGILGLFEVWSYP